MSITSQRSTTAPIPEDQPSIPSEMVEEFRAVCRDAWKQGLLSGCNGNASRRLGSHAPGAVCITRSGTAKGRITQADCCLMDIGTGATLRGGPASSESGMHLAIYRARPDCDAILHTHPRRLLALSLRMAGRQEDFLRLPLFEAEVWRAKLGFSPALPPGSTDLAEAVAMQVSYSISVNEARKGNPDFLVTGQIDEANIRETSTTDMATSLRANYVLANRQARIMRESLNASQSRTGLPSGSAADNLMLETLRDLVKPMAQKIVQTIEAKK